MKTKILPALLLGAVLLAGCAGQKPAASTMDLNGPPMEGCSVKQVVPDPNPTIQALLPPVSDDDHILGKRGAKSRSSNTVIIFVHIAACLRRADAALKNHRMIC